MTTLELSQRDQSLETIEFLVDSLDAIALRRLQQRIEMRVAALRDQERDQYEPAPVTEKSGSGRPAAVIDESGPGERIDELRGAT